MADPIPSITAAVLLAFVGLLLVAVLMLARLVIRSWRMSRRTRGQRGERA
ncbi:hypothetical protein [Microterricola pindariensis]|nr:hypothetical protein [Microterricola pindariensis]